MRAADLNPDAIRQRFGESLEAVHFDFTKAETITPAVQGVMGMFLMRPPQITDVKRLMFPVIDAARAVGVEQVVFLSLIGIETNQRAPHYKVEQHLPRLRDCLDFPARQLLYAKPEYHPPG